MCRRHDDYAKDGEKGRRKGEFVLWRKEERKKALLPRLRTNIVPLRIQYSSAPLPERRKRGKKREERDKGTYS
jgi:hypothetical protein